MLLKYIDKDGKETEVETVESLIERIENEEIEDSTLIYHEKSHKWEPATKNKSYCSVKDLENRSTDNTGPHDNEGNYEISRAIKFIKSSYFVWLLLLISFLIYFYVEAVFLEKSERFSSVFGYDLGSALIYGIIGTFLISISPIKRLGLSKNHYFASVILVLVIYNSANSIQEHISYVEQKEVIKELADNYSNVINNEDVNEINQLPSKKLLSKGAQDLQKISSLVNQHLILQQESAKRFEANLNLIEGALSEDTLTNHRLIDDALERLEKFKVAASDYVETSHKILNLTRKKIMNLDIHSKTKSDALEGMEKRERTSMPLLEEFVEVEKKVADTIIEMLKLAKISDFQFDSGGNPILSTQKAADEFNRLYAELDELTKKEESILEKIKAEDDKAQSNLESLYKNEG